MGSGIVLREEEQEALGRQSWEPPGEILICPTFVISFRETSDITDYATVDDFSSPGTAGEEHDANMGWQAASKANLRSLVKTSKKCQRHSWK